MNLSQNHSGKGVTLIAAFAALALAGCGTSKREQPVAAASVAATPAAAPSASQEARSKRATHHETSPEASTKQTTAAVLSQIHQTDLMEIQLGQLAQQKAASDEVRAYAVQLVEDHTSADRMVADMAAKSGVKLHQTAKASPLGRKLKSANGTEFDKLFLQETRADHEKLIRTLQQEREDASDDDLEALIDKVMPILEQHKELAEVLMKKEKA